MAKADAKPMELNQLPAPLKPFLDPPARYQLGDRCIWTDPYISEQLLDAHLDPDTDRASYRPQTIERTIDWLQRTRELEGSSRILDLGCGPGLYTRRWAERGFKVTGIDFNRHSLTFAREQAKQSGYEIDYCEGDYLTREFGSPYDLITIISCDFGVLKPDEQLVFLEKVRNSLNPNGVFAFDVLTPHYLSKLDQEPRLSFHEGGFWHSQSYHLLTQSWVFHDLNLKVDRNTILTKHGEVFTVLIWEHVFDSDQLSVLLAKSGLRILSCTQDLTGKPVSANSETLGIVVQREAS